jgi:hypothetical protein
MSRLFLIGLSLLTVQWEDDNRDALPQRGAKNDFLTDRWPARFSKSRHPGDFVGCSYGTQNQAWTIARFRTGLRARLAAIQLEFEDRTQ